MDKGKKQKLITQIVCVFLSFGLWLYITNVENPMRTSEVKNIPVELINLDSVKSSELSIVDNQQFKVDLKVEGTSSEVMNVKKEDFKIVVDMSTYVLKEGENTIPVQILAYPENISIKNNGYVGIKVKLEKLLSKEITVTSSVKLSFAEHVYEKGQSVWPAKVTVTGGQSNIKKISKAVLVGEQKDISNNITKDYDIRFLDENNEEVKNVESNIKRGKLSVEVLKGKTVPIKGNTTGAIPKGYKLENIELSPSYVKITGDDKVLEAINEINTNPINLSDVFYSKDIKVKLNLPEGVYLKDTADEINAKISVIKEPLHSATVLCPVQYINLPEGFNIQSSTESIQVTVEGLRQDLDSINAENIQVIMDLSQVNSEGTFSYTPSVSIVNNSSVTVSNAENVTVTVAAAAEVTPSNP